LLKTLPGFQDAKIAEALVANAQFAVGETADRRAAGLLTAAAFNQPNLPAACARYGG
jgi:hypothetical protein